MDGIHAKQITSIQNFRLQVSRQAPKLIIDLNQSDRAIIKHLNANKLELSWTKALCNNACQQAIKKINSMKLVSPFLNISLKQQGKLSLELTYLGHTLPVVSHLKPEGKYAHRLLISWPKIDYDQAEILSYFQDLPEPQRGPRKHKFIVAIDPGHGGIDPGAIGRHGTQEKRVVFKIAQALLREIFLDGNLNGFLVRSGDYYLSLNERVQIARRKRADLFVSIHSDAHHNPYAKGASIYVLSRQGASSLEARYLANNENKADLIGNLGLGTASKQLNSVLLDLSMTASQIAGLEAANKILAAMRQAVPIHKNYVEQAGFAVLKAPEIPSLLIETGFISNSNMEYKLQSMAFQQIIAKSLFQGIKSYFNNKLP